MRGCVILIFADDRVDDDAVTRQIRRVSGADAGGGLVHMFGSGHSVLPVQV